uniref:Uncharacterized protein n=1 Tax=Falco tinnunculus TaxID=100819 RepID=A0A8C4U285_FALTI
MYWMLSAVGSSMGLGGRGGRLRASSVSHCTSTSLYSSMAVRASSTDECPLFLLLTWIFFCSSCLARLFSEMLALPGSPALWFSTGLWLVSRVLSFGWKYFRAWKSLWMACPTTILSFKIFRIWKRQKGLDRGLAALVPAGAQQPLLLQQRPALHEPLVLTALLLAATLRRAGSLGGPSTAPRGGARGGR